jgi:hypothetical protein
VRWIFLTLILLNALLAVVELSEKEGKRSLLDVRYRLMEGSDSLVLLKESTASSSSGAPGKKGLLPPDPLCLLLGPFVALEVSDRLLGALAEAKLQTELVTQEIVKAPNYWVYLPPFEVRRDAVKKLRALQAAKVDSYLITQGELANGISLGVFENIDSARRMLKRRKNQGYNVEVAELGKKEFEYWVAIVKSYSEELDLKVSEIVNKLEMTPEKRQISCKSVASEKKLP